MAEKTPLNFKKLLKTKGLLPVIIAVAAGLILLSLPNTEAEEATCSLPDTEAYCEALEKKAKSLIESLGGVKECEVFIMLESGYSYSYASDWHTKDSDGTKETDKSIIFSESSSGKTPVIVSTEMPKVASVAVVCKKASYETQYRIIELIKALFNIPSNRISVQT